MFDPHPCLMLFELLDLYSSISFGLFWLPSFHSGTCDDVPPPLPLALQNMKDLPSWHRRARRNIPCATFSRLCDISVFANNSQAYFSFSSTTVRIDGLFCSVHSLPLTKRTLLSHPTISTLIAHASVQGSHRALISFLNLLLHRFLWTRWPYSWWILSWLPRLLWQPADFSLLARKIG
jgi:branched-subunit amino acid transport protein